MFQSFFPSEVVPCFYPLGVASEFLSGGPACHDCSVRRSSSAGRFV